MKKLIIFIFLFLYYNFAVDFEGLVIILRAQNLEFEKWRHLKVTARMVGAAG